MTVRGANGAPLRPPQHKNESMKYYYEIKPGDKIVDPKDGKTLKEVERIDKFTALGYFNFFYTDGTLTRIPTGKHHATKIKIAPDL